MTEKSENTSPSVATADRPTVLDVNTVAPGTLFQIPTSDNTLISPEVREQVENVLRFLSTFPDFSTVHWGTIGNP